MNRLDLECRRLHLLLLLFLLEKFHAGLSPTVHSLDLERRGGELLFLRIRLFLPRQLLPRLATPVHGLNLQSGSLLLFPVLAQLLAGFLTPMRRLNLERGSLLFLALSLFKEVVDRPRHQPAHRRLQLLGVLSLCVLIRQHLVVEFVELAEVQGPRIVLVVVLHQRLGVLVKGVPVEVDSNLLQHVVQLWDLQAPRLVRVKLLERGVDPEELLLFLPGLLATLDGLYLDRRRG